MTNYIVPVARTIKEFCAAYGIGKTTTFALIKGGKLIAKKVGGRTLIDEASARSWYESLSTNQSANETRIEGYQGGMSRTAYYSYVQREQRLKELRRTKKNEA